MPSTVSNGSSFTESSESIAWSDAYTSSSLKVGYGVIQRIAFGVNQSAIPRGLGHLVAAVVALQFLTIPLEHSASLDPVLEPSSRWISLIRAFNARFWQLLVRSHSDSIDTEKLLELVRNGAHHQSVARDILQDLLRENPNNVGVLRAWAHHLIELKNDKEGAENVLVMADQYEEEQTKKHSKKKKKERESDGSVFQMLLFLPVNVLDSVQSIHDYLEMGKSASEIEEISEKEQERVTKSIVDACEDIVILCNKDRNIDVFNPVAEHVTGFTVAEALGKNVSIVIPADVEANQKLLNSVFRTVVHGKVTTALFIRDITAIKEREAQIIHERNRAEGLLLNIFPKQVAEKLNKAAEGSNSQLDEASVFFASHFEEATVLFADICGFTTMSSSLTAQKIVEMLNGVFSLWDNALDTYGVEKIKTIGDAYMVVSGVPERCEDHADRMLRFAVAMLGSLNDYTQETSAALSIRIGINAGPVVAGIIGTRKIAYDLWGDTVNVASRMEHSGLPGTIQVTEAMYRRHYLKHEQHFVCRGALAIQGKGDIVCYNCKPPSEVLAQWEYCSESSVQGAPFDLKGAPPPKAQRASRTPIVPVTRALSNLTETSARFRAPEAQFRPEGRRWLVLFVVCLFSFSQNLVCMTFSSVPRAAEAFFGISAAEVDMQLNWAAITYLVAALPVLWLLSRPRGLRLCLLVGSASALLGALLRVVPCLFGSFAVRSRLWPLLDASSVANGVGGPAVMSTGSLLSATWFPDSERATATAIAVLAPSLSMAVSFLMGPALVHAPADFPRLVYIEAALGALQFVLVALFMRAGPASPPSASAAYARLRQRAAEKARGPARRGVSESEPLLQVADGCASIQSEAALTLAPQGTAGAAAGLYGDLRRLLGGWSVVVAMVSAGLQMCVFGAWSGCLQLTLDSTLSVGQIGWIGFSTTLAAIAGGCVGGRVVDALLRRHLKAAILFSLFGGFCGLCWFSLAAPSVVDKDPLLPAGPVSTGLSASAVGLFYGAMTPMYMELAAELSFPVSEDVSAGVISWLSNVGLMVALFVAPRVPPSWFNAGSAGLMVLSAALMVAVREAYVRSDVGRPSSAGDDSA
eukprot:m51a1_g4598 putative adenylate and guanylate cyclase catalytic domain protein (1092) ;mRNA; f:218422-225800